MRDPNLFHIWIQWLNDLGGTFVPYRDLEEKKEPTGRRCLDKKPRQYELDPEKYATNSNGSVVRL